VCTFDENLTAQEGDFADPSYSWSGRTFSPASITIGDNTTATVELTNTYTRNFSSLVISKNVVGPGYLGGDDPHFTIAFDCGSGIGTSAVFGEGEQTTVPGLPVGAVCGVAEIDGGGDPNLWPSPSLLSPGYAWGTPTFAPSNVVTIAADGSSSVTVSNPTVPIFGKVSVSKQLSGETQGVVAGSTFTVTVSCPGLADQVFTLPIGGTGTTDDIPVGTTCSVSETAPTGGLLDSSYAWGAPVIVQPAQITASGQVVEATVTNPVSRVSGQFTIGKAPIVPAGIVDPLRTFDIGYSCVYGSDAPVVGTVSLTADEMSAPVPVLIGSVCTVTEDIASLSAPPTATDPSWVWLAPSYDPDQVITVSDPGTTQAVIVANSIQQLTGSFSVAKVVTGAGKAGGYTPGDSFGFDISCTDGQNFAINLADDESFEAPAIPALTECTVTELTKPTTPPAYGWDPVQFFVNAQPPAPGDAPGSVTFQVPASGDPIQIIAANPITPRLGAVQVTKLVTGETAGLAGEPEFSVTINCGPGGSYQVSVPADGTVTQDGIPLGSICSATETNLPADAFVDPSYGWSSPTYSEPVTVNAAGTDNTLTVSNPIIRITAPLTVVKTLSGAQGVVDPDRTYPVNWSCSYGPDSEIIAEGDIDIVADPGGVVVDPAVPITSECTATEGDLGAPSVDPAYRWLEPVITGTSITVPGPNTVTVANSLTRDSGTVLVRKQVTGAVEGYRNLGTGAEDFTLHGQCSVPGQPGIPTRTADGSIADGGEVPITASIGWTCSGFEDSPGQNLLKDDSYAWGEPVLNPAGTFVLTRESPQQIFLAQNPIVRVSGSLQISKTVTDPSGIVDPDVTFSGGYSCQYGTDAPQTGSWSITGAAGGNYLVPDTFYLGSVCTITEDDQNAKAATGLPDGSWTWDAPVIGGPATVVAGGPATVAISNSVSRLWAGLDVTKAVVDPDGGVLAGAQFPGSWSCELGDVLWGGRFTVGADATV
ncbi:MAG: DUF5979 domain-containing protein, partial [Nakamurella sp.]